MDNWQDMLIEEMTNRGETMADVESSTLTSEQMKVNFDSGFGSTHGEPFTVWTRNSVYFPICYDGAESCGSVSRNPDEKPTAHQGGG